MSGQIRISPEDMRARAGQYRNEAQTISQVISNMDNLLAALQSEWEGEASKAFAERYAELKPSFQSMQQLVEDIAQALDQSANRNQETDESIAAGFRRG
ncbi:MAG TPA: WXG100 family type VII secretion target [Candidatus Aphodovivens avistercoris]|nr:WXG100 family type VII secretion target [Candidatus Aphodovivens avistercoris]